MDDLPLTCITNKINKKLQELENSDDFQGLVELGNELTSLLKEASSSLLGSVEDQEFNAKYTELKKQALSLIDRTYEFEEKHLKYNIPSLIGVQSFKGYLENLQEFMKNVWEKESKEKREKGGKSLIEWLQHLDHHHQSERKTTIEEMKKAVIDLGTDISVIITEFLLLVVILGDRNDIMKNLDDFKAMIKLLSVEKTNDSIVIKTFLSVIQLVVRTMKKRKSLSGKRGEKSEVAGEIELEIMRMILKEILRLEVALCCPDLVMVLTDEIYLSMISHLRNFFECKLSDLNLKVNELRIQVVSLLIDENHDSQEERKLKIAKETMGAGAHNIWTKFDINSSSSSS
ncbi:uncharacterized protein LOC133039894 [Cannabis sativa]|uniref:Uncharacterized protein n=1 Tax=Cannabis sativa TaxID=3483 RepID=A0A803QE13_CANSA|nr:uncharacterized protein LOC133039894 [Cannabis sativa]